METRDQEKFDALWQAIEEDDMEAFERELGDASVNVVQMHEPRDSASGPPSDVMELQEQMTRPTLLGLVCTHGQERMAERLIAAGAPLESGPNGELPPLFHAINSAELAMVRLLLESGADPSDGQFAGVTIPKCALAVAEFDAVKLMLRHSSQLPPLHLAVLDGRGDPEEIGDIAGVDAVGATALHWGAQLGDCDAIRALLGRGADLDAADSLGQTPAQWAAAAGQVGALRLLMDEGADPAKRDDIGRSCFVTAAWKGQLSVLQFLISEADVDDEELSEGLHHAAGRGERETVRLLLQHGADTEQPYSSVSARIQSMRVHPGWASFGTGTALYTAIANRQLEVARLIIDAGAGLNSSGTGLTPLGVACHSDYPEGVALLLEHGADPTAPAAITVTPLSLAAEAGAVECARLLVEAGAEVDTPDGHRQTPVARACFAGQAEMVDFLIEQGADINMVDSCGRGPMHLAAVCGDEAIIRRLQDAGLDLHAQDNEGHGVVHMAAMFGEPEAIQVLAELGADLNMQARDGCTPMIRAEQFGREDMVQALIDAGARVTYTRGQFRPQISLIEQSGGTARVGVKLRGPKPSTRWLNS